MSEQLALFDYNQLPQDLAERMQIRAVLADSYYDIAENALWQAGKVLAEAQDDLAEDFVGCFQKWVETETKFSKMTAYRLISVYRNIPESACTKLGHGKSFLYALAAAPEPVRDEALGLIDSGEDLTLKQLNELKAKHQALVTEAAKTKESLEIQKTVLTQLQQAKTEAETKLSDLIETQDVLVAEKAKQLADQLAQAKIESSINKP